MLNEEGENNVTTIRKYITLIIVLLLAALGISLQLKAAIGVAPFDALNLSVSYVFDLRVGDVVMLINVIFVIGQILILKRETDWTIFMQFIIGILLGQFVNFFSYVIFDQWVVENYILRLLLLIGGALWVPIFIGSVMVLDLVTMPVENLAMVLSNEIPFSFGQIRQFMDITFVVLSLVLTVVFSDPLTIREGTIISALTFGPLLSFYMPKIEVLFKKWRLIQ